MDVAAVGVAAVEVAAVEVAAVEVAAAEVAAVKAQQRCRPAVYAAEYICFLPGLTMWGFMPQSRGLVGCMLGC